MAEKFEKPALGLKEQLGKWQERGLVIANPDAAVSYLRFIGYYRFSAYTLPFQDPAHHDKHFRKGTKFEHILRLYVFDRELRLLSMDAIERIEVAVRTCIVNELSLKHGPHWFAEAKFFKPMPHFAHQELLTKIREELGIPEGRTRPDRPHNEVFINHYFGKYNYPELPPSWMVFEVLSLGILSQVLANLLDAKDRSLIAAPFAVDEQVLQSWLHCLSYVRNICAHHGRLWNRQLVIKPIVAKKHAQLVIVKDRFYAVAVILHYLMRIVAPNSRWHERLARLLTTHLVADKVAMGFPPGWREHAFWELNHSDYEI